MRRFTGYSSGGCETIRATVLVTILAAIRAAI
jgi:hypothetical protein